MPFNKRSFFLAATAIELALLLGYGRSQYTGNCINVINTTFGGAAEDSLAYIVPRGTVFPRNFFLPREIVTVLIRSLGALGVSHVGTLCSGPSMSTGGTGGTRRAKAASCQLAIGRRAGDKALLLPPTPQRTVLQLLPSLRIKPPPGRCRWWRA